MDMGGDGDGDGDGGFDDGMPMDALDEMDGVGSGSAVVTIICVLFCDTL
jgi:hypothetical protein